MSNLIRDLWPGRALPLIGMLHAPALPGSPRNRLNRQQIIEHVLNDARTLVEGGIDGLMLENFGDVPFFKDHVPTQTISFLTVLAAEVVRECRLPLGINVLRNDGCAAVAVAAATGAGFVRVNVLTAARLTDQGIIEGRAAEIHRLLHQLGNPKIGVLADIDVKHSSPLGERRPIADEALDTVKRGLADGLIISGSATGSPTEPGLIQPIRSVLPEVSILVGSGVTEHNLQQFAQADAVIVGSSLKPGQRADQPIELERVQQLVEARNRVSSLRSA